MVAWEAMRANKDREDIDIMDISTKYAQSDMTEVLERDIDGLMGLIGQDVNN